jgi:hypothetical protein
MSIFSRLLQRLTGRNRPAVDPEQFIFVKILDPVMPFERGAKYEDPLEALLEARGLGTVSGSGSGLGDPRPDGTRPIAYCGVDIETTLRDQVLEMLREEVPKLGSPVGTELHYTRNGVRLQDELRVDGWVLSKPRTFLHPGFRC